MEKLYSALCQWIVLHTHYINFFTFIHFTNQITLIQNLAQRLKLILRFSSTKRQKNIPLWTHLRHTGWRKNGKTFIRCYTIVLKFWDEFNANFVLLYFLSYRSIKVWHLYLKYVFKNNKVVHLRLLFQILFNIKKHLALVLKKFVCVVFCVF